MSDESRERRDAIEEAAVTLIAARVVVPREDLKADLAYAARIGLDSLPDEGPITEHLDHAILAAVRWLLLDGLKAHPEWRAILERWEQYSARRVGG